MASEESSASKVPGLTLEHPLRLLVIEDSENDMRLLLRELERAGITVAAKRVEAEASLLQALKSESWDLVISDFNLPCLDGIRTLELVRRSHPDLPFILVSGSVGEQIAVEAMKSGAQDYIMKDNLARLASAVKREILEAGERRARRTAEEALKEKDRQLIVAQRMEAIGRLAGGIAHDLNNVIGACTLYAEFALDPDQDIAAVRDSVQEIVKAQERATRLVRQLLAFSSRQFVDPQVISLNQLTLDIERMLAQILGEDIELILELDQDVKNIHWDPTQIEQILLNLVVNARDAMPSGGRLRIETANEYLDDDHPVLAAKSEVTPGPYVRLTVSDTGTGIDEAVLGKIFEPFFTTKEQGRGTGLGLSTVFGIVKQMKGAIQVQTELGKGTSFSIYLPCIDENCTELGIQKPSPSEVAGLGKMTILLVEDDDSVRRALERALNQQGHRVFIAKDGEEGCRTFDEHRTEIDLVVSDIVMPKVSGPEMAKRMWSSNPPLKVLFLTGYSPDALFSHFSEQGSAFWLAKPFNIAQFSKKVSEILVSSKY